MKMNGHFINFVYLMMLRLIIIILKGTNLRGLIKKKNILFRITTKLDIEITTLDNNFINNLNSLKLLIFMILQCTFFKEV